jgi:hypothetical protein
MNTRALSAACAAAAICLAAMSAFANAESKRWFYAISNDDRDMHLTIQLIEEDPPSFDTTFKLIRGEDEGDGEVVFEHRQFAKDEADEVFGPGCVEDNYFEGVEFDDCDDDGTDECTGICGTAYRYEVVDECVPGNYALYRLYDETTLECVDSRDIEFVSHDDSCLDADAPDGSADSGGSGGSGCSVTGVPDRTTEAALAAFMLLIGVGFAVASRRK